MWPYEYDEGLNGVCLLGVNMCDGFAFAKGAPESNRVTLSRQQPSKKMERIFMDLLEV